MPTADTTSTTPGPADFRLNKRIPAVLESPILTALSFFPALRATPIRFVLKRRIRSSVMQAQPVFTTLLRGPAARAYQINISAWFTLVCPAMPIQHLPAEVLIGWIGHELGHIMDYETRTNAGLVGFGVGYVLSAAYVKRAEQRADQYAVQAGLGPFLVATKRFILDHAGLPARYKAKIARLYVSPDSIVAQIRNVAEQTPEAQPGV